MASCVYRQPVIEAYGHSDHSYLLTLVKHRSKNAAAIRTVAKHLCESSLISGESYEAESYVHSNIRQFWLSVKYIP